MSKQVVKKTKPDRSGLQPDNSLAVWLRLQKSLAEKNDIALTTLSCDGAVIGRIENDNSICQMMRVSSERSELCAADCGAAYSRAVEAGEPIKYRCHAGLHCFATPVQINSKKLVVLGGRVFNSANDYAQFLSRYDNLSTVRNGECLKNVHFVGSREFAEAIELVTSTASYHFQSHRKTDPQPAEKAPTELMDAHLEIIRLTDQLESRKRAISQFYDFLRAIASSLDSQKVYQAVLAKFSEILRSERSSLMILNEESNELALEAALGADSVASGPIRVKLGEGIAGTVLATGAPMLVRDAENDARVPRARLGRYKTKSFISFPITLGPRKVGVINLTDRTDGTPYENDDLAVLELMSSHLALIIDRAEWHKKAETYQQMSLTDPLTGLPNRRYLEDRLFEEVERSKRYDTPLSFMIIDVDRFKEYNDIYGHTNADRVLVKTAQILRNSIRAIDMSARFAGDEFCIVLPETEPQAAARIAERLRVSVNEAEYRTEQGEPMGRVSISTGVSSFSPQRQSPLAIIEAADRALYKAKMRGRNCVAVYEGAAAAD
ncbi:MAG TPA: diguanylate cyclase [Blastocatellia bacterium]|nr:diguanylate cyclase [Blastocatellia bacterium]